MLGGGDAGEMGCWGLGLDGRVGECWLDEELGLVQLWLDYELRSVGSVFALGNLSRYFFDMCGRKWCRGLVSGGSKTGLAGWNQGFALHARSSCLLKMAVPIVLGRHEP